MDKDELSAMDPGIEGLLNGARRPKVLDAARKDALWRRIDGTIREVAVSPSPEPRAPDRARHGRRSAVRGIVGAGAVAVAVATVLWMARAATPVSGTASVEERTSVAIAERARAVAEPGAELRWEVDTAGNASIRQRAGRVFYRVEPGGDFVVSTELGEVVTTGTSFEVVLTREARTPSSDGDAEALTVLVYEGGVIARNRHGEVAVNAGETALVSKNLVPRMAGSRIDPEFARTLLPSDQRSSAEQRLHKRLRELETRLAEARREHRESLRREREDELEAGDEDFAQEIFEPTPQQLRKSAEVCEVQWSAPAPRADGTPLQFDAEAAELLGLSDAEREVANQIIEELNDAIVDLVRALYVDATGDEIGARTLSYDAMESEILEKTLVGEKTDAQRQVARERAGLEPPLENPTALVRLLRAHIERAMEYNHRLLAHFGPERGRQVRARMPNTLRILSGCTATE